jgi:hypothetical protein
MTRKNEDLLPMLSSMWRPETAIAERLPMWDTAAEKTADVLTRVSV